MDKNRALSIGRAYDAQALLDRADTVLTQAAQDAAELRKYGWNDARAKSLEESRLAVRNGLAGFGGGHDLVSPAFTKRRHAVAAAKLWLRRAAPVAKNVLEGSDDLDAFLKMGDFAAVSQLNRALVEKIAIFKRHAGLLAKTGKLVEA